LFPGEPGRNAISYSFFLSAVDFSVGPSFEVVVAGDSGSPDTRSMLRSLRQAFIPNAVVIFRPTTDSHPAIVQLAPFTASQLAVNGKATAYVCQDFACKLPTNDIQTMLSELGALKEPWKRSVK
jgi:hypothetical protein